MSQQQQSQNVKDESTGHQKMYTTLRTIFQQLKPAYIHRIMMDNWQDDLSFHSQLFQLIEKLYSRENNWELDGSHLYDYNAEINDVLSAHDCYQKLIELFPTSDPNYMRKVADTYHENISGVKLYEPKKSNTENVDLTTKHDDTTTIKKRKREPSLIKQAKLLKKKEFYEQQVELYLKKKQKFEEKELAQTVEVQISKGTDESNECQSFNITSYQIIKFNKNKEIAKSKIYSLPVGVAQLNTTNLNSGLDHPLLLQQAPVSNSIEIKENIDTDDTQNQLASLSSAPLIPDDKIETEKNDDGNALHSSELVTEYSELKQIQNEKEVIHIDKSKLDPSSSSSSAPLIPDDKIETEKNDDGNALHSSELLAGYSELKQIQIEKEVKHIDKSKLDPSSSSSSPSSSSSSPKLVIDLDYESPTI